MKYSLYSRLTCSDASMWYRCTTNGGDLQYYSLVHRAWLYSSYDIKKMLDMYGMGLIAKNVRFK